ncbi:MAG: carbohydrate binding family 9 domain-containing protein [Bacteroidetes bacterium]|nr:carbohydrate binding family 9 domain-containing protein [Bacteroidota bacterium]MBU1681025.1 carbohydrate binding family 9 domain-containing protein [Bacteroidota bacterium]
MKKSFLICISLILIITSSIQAQPNGKQLALKKSYFEIKIDGIIDDVWATADSIMDFTQHQPYYNQKPNRVTVAKILTTDNALYCLIKCYDDIENIQRTKGKLDDFAGDVVSLMLDTFNDKRTAYKFAVTATGVRADSRMLDDARNRDYNWDGIWFADGEIYDWGYVVEMEIPYKSIQYDESLNEWGLDFDRWIPHLNEDIYWCSYEENEGQRISKFGKLIFNGFKPSVKGLNLEIYPVAISKVEDLGNNKYDIEPDAGLDIFYNPSQKLTLQLTANPDFAQIEADPFDFNISRFESYFEEKRPFFTEGSEVFQASGRDRNTGFYRPLELFYSRRIGKKLPDGNEVPLLFGAKAFGRLGEWEYGGFSSITGEKNYTEDGQKYTEQRATFGSVRLKKQILDNSSIGFLFVGKHTEGNNFGVLDIDGAFRTSNWQLAYQFARSFNNSEGDYAFSAGFTKFEENSMTLVRSRYVGENFEIDQVGYVPWQGTAELIAIHGPRWVYDTGTLRSFMIYGGGGTSWEKVDNYTDLLSVLGINFQFRQNWGYEMTLVGGKSKDENKKYSYFESNFSSWFHSSPNWSGNFWGGYARTYNFSRNYLAYYSWTGSRFTWKILDYLNIGTSYNMWVEGNPDGNIEDITYNARPFLSFTPVNDLNISAYVDNLLVRSTDKLEQMIFGFFFAYNFSPKSWIYFAFNEVQERASEFNSAGNFIGKNLRTTDRAGVLKIKYLYYF